MSDLKPCPFCGERVSICTNGETEYRLRWRIVHIHNLCFLAEGKLPWYESRDEMIEDWNRRDGR